MIHGQGYPLPLPASAASQTPASSPWVASFDLSGHRVVRAFDDGLVGYPSINAIEDADAIVGITTGAVAANAACDIVSSGLMRDPSWYWDLAPIFCDDNGLLTQTEPDGVWLRQVATAIAPSLILVELFPSYIRIQ